jgi:ubiquitin C-terminal hydrolase
MQPELPPQNIAQQPYVPPVIQNTTPKGPLLPKQKNNTISIVIYSVLGVIVIGLLIFGLMSFTKMNKYKNNGLCGLMNLGNTCFMNACLQVLSHTPEWNIFIKTPTFEHKLNPKPDSVLLMEWVNLSKLYAPPFSSPKSPINPFPFIQTVQKVASIKHQDLFTGYLQNDLGEFLLFLMDCFHTALQREVDMEIRGAPKNPTDEMALLCFQMIQSRICKEYSEVWDIFYGIHVSQISRLEDQTIMSQKAEPFFMMDLSLPPGVPTPSLHHCLHHYLQGETLDDPWRNDQTHTYERVQKQIKIWSFAPIVVFALKRFDPVTREKNATPVSFPLSQLDLSPFVVGYHKEQYVYECYGICNHYGNHLDGHYTAFVKVQSSGKWFHCNDHIIQEVLHPERMVTPYAYCLFYRRMGLSSGEKINNKQ